MRLVFSDGHDTGLYSWDYLHQLGMNQDQLWQDYLDRLAKAGASRGDVAHRQRRAESRVEEALAPSCAPAGEKL